MSLLLMNYKQVEYVTLPTLIHLHLIITVAVEPADGLESTFEITAIYYPGLKRNHVPAKDMYCMYFRILMSLSIWGGTDSFTLCKTSREASEEI